MWKQLGSVDERFINSRVLLTPSPIVVTYGVFLRLPSNNAISFSRRNGEWRGRELSLQEVVSCEDDDLLSTPTIFSTSFSGIVVAAISNYRLEIYPL
jgi:hypothetical protein